MSNFFDKSVIIQAHRGMHGSIPENSLDACLSCKGEKVSAIEVDIVCSKDGKLVVSHDPYINPDLHSLDAFPKRNINFRNDLNIFEMDWDEISRVPYSDKFDTNNLKLKRKVLLSELAKELYLNDINIPLNIEIKSHPDYYGTSFPHPNEYVEYILDCLNKLNYPFFVQSFDLDPMKILKGKSRALDEIILFDEPKNEWRKIEECIEYGFKSFGLNHKKTSESLVTSLLKRDIHVSLWTVNSHKDIEHWLNEGIRNIISDFPLLVSEIVESKGLDIKKFNKA